MEDWNKYTCVRKWDVDWDQERKTILDSTDKQPGIKEKQSHYKQRDKLQKERRHLSKQYIVYRLINGLKVSSINQDFLHAVRSMVRYNIYLPGKVTKNIEIYE